MRGVRFTIPKGYVGGVTDRAHLSEGEEPDGEALYEAVIEALGTEVPVTVGGATMHLAAWRDPDHWADDWQQELDVPHADVPAAVEALLTGAVEGD